eukprot:TRINITY_DN20436_c0_g1_i2.p1 TRINITY_DN20436_c0_g1~~TRINITY_DN20436_c0_g1_i2.p1  ORF type:complete len:727 (+),score=136.13 TRINITY_DN20436_c0_g1_i2:49-2181(+)
MNARLACVSYKDHADSPDANATVFWTPSGNFHERSAARHERWLKDSDELLRAAPVRLLELPPCSKPLRGTSVTAGTLTAADVECLTDGSNDRRIQLEGLASYGSTVALSHRDISDGYVAPSEVAPSGVGGAQGSTSDLYALDECAQMKVNSLRFVAWQQTQLGKDLERREEVLKKTSAELRQLCEGVRARDQAQRAVDVGLHAEEENLHQIAEQCLHGIRSRWQALDEREAELCRAGADAKSVAEALEQRLRRLPDIKEAIAATLHQTQELEAEIGLLRERQQEVEAREAGLNCMQEAWGCSALARLGLSAASMPLPENASQSESGRRAQMPMEKQDVLQEQVDFPTLLRTKVATRIEELLSRIEPACRDRSVRRAIIWSSLGGLSLTALRDASPARGARAAPSASPEPVGRGRAPRRSAPADLLRDSGGADSGGAEASQELTFAAGEAFDVSAGDAEAEAELLPSASEFVGLDVGGSSASLLPGRIPAAQAAPCSGAGAGAGCGGIRRSAPVLRSVGAPGACSARGACSSSGGSSVLAPGPAATAPGAGVGQGGRCAARDGGGSGSCQLQLSTGATGVSRSVAQLVPIATTGVAQALRPPLLLAPPGWMPQQLPEGVASEGGGVGRVMPSSLLRRSAPHPATAPLRQSSSALPVAPALALHMSRPGGASLSSVAPGGLAPAVAHRAAVLNVSGALAAPGLSVSSAAPRG